MPHEVTWEGGPLAKLAGRVIRLGFFIKDGNQGEVGRIDLLTVVTHELGHLLGLGHEDVGVMAERLDPGVREVDRHGPASPTPTGRPLAPGLPAPAANDPADLAGWDGWHDIALANARCEFSSVRWLHGVTATHALP